MADRLVPKLRIWSGKIGVTVLIVLMLICSPTCQAASFYDSAQQAEYARRYDDAIELYKQSIAHDSGRASAAAGNLYKLYIRLQRYDDAAQCLKETERLTGDSHLALQLADLYRDAGRHYEAQALYQDILAQHPTDEEAMYGMAVSLEATGNYSTAEDLYHRIVESHAEHWMSAQKRLSNMAGAEGNAIDTDVLKGRWTNSGITVFIADGSSVRGYRSEMYQMAVEAVSAWSDAMRGKLDIQLTNDQQAANIEVIWEQSIPHALGVTHNEAESGRLLHSKVLIAVDVDTQGRLLPEESNATRQLYESQPRILRWVLLHELGHAIGLTHSPRSEDVMVNGVPGLGSHDLVMDRTLQKNDIARAMAIYSQSQQPLNAISTTSQAAEPGVGVEPGLAVRSATEAGRSAPSVATSSPSITPGPASRLSPEISEAMVDMQEGRYDASMECLTTAINRNPKNATAHYLMAITLVNLRQYDEAAKQYKEVLKLSPTGQLAKRASAGLAKVLNGATP